MVELSQGRIFVIFPIILILALQACKNETINTDESARITELYKEWVEITNEKDIRQWSAYISPNAVFLPPDSPPLESLSDIKEYYIQLFQDSNFKLDCEQLSVEVAESGDIAWSRGVCKSEFTNDEAEVENGFSKWTKIWVRMSDGTWKCRLNTWNYN